MHASMLPIHEKDNRTKTFNVSQHQKGNDYFRGFQDRFYEYMKERYPDKYKCQPKNGSSAILRFSLKSSYKNADKHWLSHFCK